MNVFDLSLSQSGIRAITVIMHAVKVRLGLKQWLGTRTSYLARSASTTKPQEAN